MQRKVFNIFGQIFNALFGLCPATGSLSTILTLLGYIFPPLVVAFPWAFLFAAIGEHLLVAVFRLSDSSVLYILLMILFWVVSIIPIGLAVRDRSRTVTRLVAGIGWVAVLGAAFFFIRMNW